MIKDDVQSQNRRGRPPTGTNPSVGVRLPPPEMAALDNWRRQQPDMPTRPEAIRRLIEIGLNSNPKAGGASFQSQVKA